LLYWRRLQTMRCWVAMGIPAARCVPKNNNCTRAYATRGAARRACARAPWPAHTSF